MGSVGALLPSATREDKDFFSHLEMHMRQEWQPLTGRDHMSYRSYFGPVKEVGPSSSSSSSFLLLFFL